MTNCIYDPAIRLAAPEQLRSSACGNPMLPAQADRHTLVYRCDPDVCGEHVAEIDAVEAGLVREYRAFRVHECWGRPTEALLTAMYDALKLAWVSDGRVCPGAVRFRDSA
ncbi:hypothetical protein LX16_4746 [Stackebrandtia albiflava]|uniref:Uncharacterized protein n=1 Tax=Stackebrandtia albiflava TaxID=406432 RepID=A0A562UQR3_9ACTN|nr:hypothetical protein [Stackebrandtia albiflava]TWJ07963.1 hypothetical protein LX16_4746 [Stackebrandtia albiflava]